MILTGSESSAHAFVVEPLINPKTSSFVAISNALKHDVLHSKSSIVRPAILSIRTSQSILMKWREIYRWTETLMKCLGIYLKLANTILVTVVLNLKKHLELLKKTWRVALTVWSQFSEVRTKQTKGPYPVMIGLQQTESWDWKDTILFKGAILIDSPSSVNSRFAF